MRSEQCEGCGHLRPDGECAAKGRPIRKIRGCSRSATGKIFLSAKSGREAYRREVLGKRRKGEGK